MGRVGGRGDRHHRAGFRHRGRGRQDGGAAETVADEERGRALDPPQVVGGRDQVGDIGGESRIGELAFARAEPGEIEAQHRDAERGQPLRDALGRMDVLAAGEAVGKQRIGAAFRRPGGR